MSETARRNIELTVQVNVELARRALKQVEQDAEKSAVAVSKASQKAAKEEVASYAASAKEIGRISSQLVAQRRASMAAGLRDAKQTFNEEVQAAKAAAEAKKQIIITSDITLAISRPLNLSRTTDTAVT